MVTAKWLTHGKQLQEVAVWGTLKKPPSSRPILIYFEFRSNPYSLLTFAWTLTRPTKFNRLRQNIVFSYSERIPVSFSWLFHYFSFFFCYFTLLVIFTTIILLLLFYLFIFMKIILFFHVPECSGMFRNVPACSMFWVLSTPWVVLGTVVIAAKVIYCLISYRKCWQTNLRYVRLSSCY